MSLQNVSPRAILCIGISCSHVLVVSSRSFLLVVRNFPSGSNFQNFKDTQMYCPDKKFPLLFPISCEFYGLKIFDEDLFEATNE